MPGTGFILYETNSLQGPLANAFLLLINALFFNVKLIGRHNEYPDDKAERLLNEEQTTFDFIIVGAGAAGCALANRLTEEDQWSVLVLEAGDYPPISSGVPAFFPTFLASSTNTWDYIIEKDKHACHAHRDKLCRITRGRVVGGSSSVNNLHYRRPARVELEYLGNYTDAIFDSIEFYADKLTKGDIYLKRSEYNDSIKSALKDVYAGASFQESNDKSLLGYTESLLTIKDAERFNLARAFLSPIKSRSKFFLVKDALVDGVVTSEPINKRAVGVNVSVSDKRIFVRARKEVILTAGAINNAKLLLLSGIGPNEYLDKRNIKPIANLPGVGKNLQMHLMVPMFIGLNSDSPEHYEDLDLMRDVFEYVIYKQGDFAHTGINDLVLYMSTEEFSSQPNIAIYHHYFKMQDRMLGEWLDGFQFHRKVEAKLVSYNHEMAIIMFMVTLVRPRSRGEVVLNDTHHLSNPKVTGHFFSDPDDADLASLVSAFSLVTNISAALNGRFLNVGVPDCGNYKFCSEHYVRCYVRGMVRPNGDVSGTTMKGPECDRHAVVKDDLEVSRVRCLRIADSSVLPWIPVGNTVGVDAMLGIRMSDILKEKWIKDYNLY